MDGTRKLDLNLFDTHFGIWQDDARDPCFKLEVFGGLIRHLRRRGWKVGADPRVKKHHPILSPTHRLARKGNLIASVECSGRVVKMETWAETWPKVNENGHRYDFGKRERLDYLDRIRLTVEERHILEWLKTIAHISVKPANLKVGFDGVTADEYIRHEYATSWHTDKAIGRPVCSYSYNAKSADGAVVEHGATVWFTNRKGRILRGTAHYHINNMWWVVAGPWSIDNVSSHEIYTTQPTDLRRKRNHRARRGRLEGQLQDAMARMDFRRAELLRRILFGDEPVYMIWSRKNDAYYATNSCGYSTDRIRAGRYTREEAEREVRRVPHLLELVTPAGEHISMRREATAPA